MLLVLCSTDCGNQFARRCKQPRPTTSHDAKAGSRRVVPCINLEYYCWGNTAAWKKVKGKLASMQKLYFALWKWNFTSFSITRMGKYGAQHPKIMLLNIIDFEKLNNGKISEKVLQVCNIDIVFNSIYYIFVVLYGWVIIRKMIMRKY